MIDTNSSKEEVLAVVKQDGLALQSANSALQNDREIVLAAVKQNNFALEYANVALRPFLKSYRVFKKIVDQLNEPAKGYAIILQLSCLAWEL